MRASIITWTACSGTCDALEEAGGHGGRDELPERAQKLCEPLGGRCAHGRRLVAQGVAQRRKLPRQ